ncbi:MAG TPA: DMT family transporter [Burkholderiales bacterium]|nr:DMT family transporter [Burkholderiales bacterium]
MTQQAAGEPDHLPQRLWWLLAGLTLAWGFNWTAMKVALSEATPWTFRALCLGLGSAILFAALRARGHSLAVPKGERLRLGVLAFFNITCWNLLVAFGVTMIPSGRAAILAYMMPAWAIPLSILLLGERVTGAKIVGLVMGLAALALLLGEGFAALGAAPLGSLLVLGASVSWALGTVLQKRLPMSMPAGPYTAWIMLLGGIPIFIGALLLDDFRRLGEIGPRAALGIAYNVIVAFAWAHWAWIKIATSVPVTVFSLSMLLIPVVGVLSGMLFLGEHPSLTEYAALALVLGSLLTVLAPGRQAR